MRRCLLPTVILAALVGTTECGSVHPISYFMLSLPPAPSPTGDTYPVRLLVGRITTPVLFRDNRIVYRMGQTELGTYEFHRWVEPPAEMLETMLLRALRQSGKFRSVEEERSDSEGDFILSGRLDELNEVDTGSVEARVAMELELENRRTGALVWSHFYSFNEPVEGKSVAAVVDGLNRNVQRGLAELLRGLDQYFANTVPRCDSRPRPLTCRLESLQFGTSRLGSETRPADGTEIFSFLAPSPRAERLSLSAETRLLAGTSSCGKFLRAGGGMGFCFDRAQA